MEFISSNYIQYKHWICSGTGLSVELIRELKLFFWSNGRNLLICEFKVRNNKICNLYNQFKKLKDSKC
jgi:hypothetical protein